VPLATANVAVIVVGFRIVTALRVMPAAGATATVVPVVVKLVPVKVTEVVVVPRTKVLGATEVSVGSGGATTVNVIVLLVPSSACTLTVLAESVAFAATVKVVVTVASSTTVRPLAVTPVPDTVMAVAPVRPLPVNVTGTLVPLGPDVGLIEVSVDAVNVKVTALLVPPGALMVTFLAPTVAVAEIANAAVTVVSFTTVRPLMVIPLPDTVMAVAPVKPLPVSVTGTLVPRAPDVGLIEASAGPSNVNVAALLRPAGVVTVTFLTPTAAVAEIVNVVVIVVGFTTLMVPTVTPVPDTATVVPVLVKFVPVRVTATAVPRRAEFGATAVSVGNGGATTVNVTVLLVPIFACTLRVLADNVAVAAIVRVAVTVVSFTTVRPVAVTPVPDTVMAVAPVKPLPVRVTGTLVPRAPEVGLIEVNADAVKVNGMAPLVPPGVVTVTFLALSVAVAEIVNVVVIVVAFTTVMVPTVTPVPDTATEVPDAEKLVPVSVTGTAVPRGPVLGVIEASVGAAGLTTASEKF
jgi:hypothetical protein